MVRKITISASDVERMLNLLQKIKRDVGQLETMLNLLKPSAIPKADEDIFAEMDGLCAKTPDADDSRELIYTRKADE